MAFLTVEDLYGPVEVIVFSQLFEKCGTRLQVDNVIIVEGQISLREDEEAKLIANNIRFYEDNVSQTFWVKIPKGSHEIDRAKDILKAYPGDTKVVIYNEANRTRLAAEHGIEPCKTLVSNLESLLGDGCVKLI
jgi:DNA polymerase-3 subunit alpha